MERLAERIKAFDQDLVLPECANEAEIAEAERRLGIALPQLIRDLYLQVANGGFGPGEGFAALIAPLGTVDEYGQSVVEFYTDFRETFHVVFGEDYPDDDVRPWPEKLLPLVMWGCGIWSCVDCSTPALPVLRFDPNRKLAQMFRPEHAHFEGWLEDYVNGKDLWKL